MKKLGMIDEILTGIMRIMKQSFNDFFFVSLILTVSVRDEKVKHRL